MKDRLGLTTITTLFSVISSFSLCVNGCKGEWDVLERRR